MDQADRASTLEAIRNTFCAEHDVIGEKDVSFIVQICMVKSSRTCLLLACLGIDKRAPSGTIV